MIQPAVIQHFTNKKFISQLNVLYRVDISIKKMLLFTWHLLFINSPLKGQ